jgi:hypothetical protein
MGSCREKRGAKYCILKIQIVEITDAYLVCK